jgi:hypothetical protein
MPAYIIQDACSGYIWGDTRDFDGVSYSATDIVDACRKLDSLVGAETREYWQVPRLSGNSGYVVYRADVAGSEAVTIVQDGSDNDTISAVMNCCQIAGYVEWR